MKRSTIIFLSFALVFSTLLCAGCNKKNQSENNQNQESINEMSGTDLTFTGALQKHTAEFGTILYYKVSNNKIVFSFSDYIKINKTSTWSVSLDLYGRVNIPSKTADLAEGDVRRIPDEYFRIRRNKPPPRYLYNKTSFRCTFQAPQ